MIVYEYNSTPILVSKVVVVVAIRIESLHKKATVLFACLPG